MVEEEFEEVGGSGEPPERHGAELVDVVVGPMGLGEDVGDSLDHGVDPGGVAGGDAGDDVAVAEFVGAGEFHVPLPPFGLFAGGVGFGVGFDDRGLRGLQDAGGGMPADHAGNGRIHDGDLLVGEVAGEHGCFAGDPHLTATGLDDLPGLREPVLQVEHVGDQGPGGGVVGAAGDPQLGQGVLPHLRGAVPARGHHRISPPTRRRVTGCAVHPRPPGGELEFGDLGQPPYPHRIRRGLQELPRRQPLPRRRGRRRGSGLSAVAGVASGGGGHRSSISNDCPIPKEIGVRVSVFLHFNDSQVINRVFHGCGYPGLPGPVLWITCNLAPTRRVLRAI